MKIDHPAHGTTLKTAFIAGASGLVGHTLLNLLLNAPEYGQVTAIVRHALPLHHEKLVQIIDPMTDGDFFASRVRGDDVFCCLGTTQKKAGSQAAFRCIDYDLPMALARAAKQNGVSHFIVISAMGANPESFSFYSRVKGQLERDLGDLALPRLSIVRPSLLLGHRDEKRLLEEIGQRVGTLIGALLPANFRPIGARKVAQAMLTIARRQGNSAVFDSGTLRELARQPA